MTAAAFEVSHKCIVLGDGSVQCWGSNVEGQLGNGTTVSNEQVAQDVQGLGGKAIGIVVGGGWSCALIDDGTVDCWGFNGGGQLGDGTTKNRSTAAPVQGLSGKATAIAGGATYTCALIADGTVECWGFGKGVSGDAEVPRVAPAPVSGLNGKATSIAAGKEHACALIDDGTVRCWGGNRIGELGDGTLTDRSAAVQVEMLLGRAVGVVVGDDHSCALLEDGPVYCWGANSRGQLGALDVYSRTLPTAVPGLGGTPTAIAASAYHTCALLPSGSVYCWGFGSRGAVVTLSFDSGADTSTLAPSAQPCVPLLDGTCGVDGNKCSGPEDGSGRDSVCARIGDLPPGWELPVGQRTGTFGDGVTIAHPLFLGEPRASVCGGGSLLNVLYTQVGWFKPDVSYEAGVIKATFKDRFMLEKESSTTIGPWSGQYLTFKCLEVMGTGTFSVFVGTDGTPNGIVQAVLQGGSEEQTARSLLSTFRILGGNASPTKPY